MDIIPQDINRVLDSDVKLALKQIANKRTYALPFHFFANYVS